MGPRAAVLAATAVAIGLTAHTAWNTRHLRRAPRPLPRTATDRTRVSVLLPARDESHRIDDCLSGLLAQDHDPLRMLILDDGSSDGTADLVRSRVGHDPRFQVLDGGREPPPPGWLGKPWACHRLARTALAAEPGPDLLIFLDADVRMAPDAVRRIGALMSDSGLDLASPYPRQVAVTPAERLIQPLLQWSWLTTLPLGIAERSPRPSLTAANGQALAITAQALRRVDGYRSVRSDVLEDLALARVVKATGGRANVTDGTDLATCRMYTSTAEVVDGYTKSLWAAFGSPTGSLAATGLLSFTYVLPPLALLLGRTRGTRVIGGLGYAAAIAGRVIVARRTGGRVADAWSHPLAILAFDALTALSWRRRHRGALSWKGRDLRPGPAVPGQSPGSARTGHL